MARSVNNKKKLVFKPEPEITTLFSVSPGPSAAGRFLVLQQEELLS